MNYAPLARIILRYLAGAAVTYGSVAPDTAESLMDPDVVLMLGLVIGAAVEGAYAFAKRRGWAT